MWRTPTKEEWQELIDNCTWTWVENFTGSGKNGYEVKGANCNNIFLLATGCRYNDSLYSAGNSGLYWSSSLDINSPRSAWDVSFDSEYVGRPSGNRCCGLSVRPVLSND